MKRSEINNYIKEAEGIFKNNNFFLPPWAAWSIEDWKHNKQACENIFESSLGWDLTDFGIGTFLTTGLLLFTIRNGNNSFDKKPYAEKIMIVKENQITPFHFHWSKTEDIINRGGGRLVVELYNSDKNEEFTNTPVVFLTDGMRREVEAGGKVILSPGESITLQTGVYHCFYAEAGSGTVMAGEVSMTNDDASDNRFHDDLGRFPKIIEDEEPYRLLVGDYGSVLRVK
ncbi:MAG: D-lyxose/D-mannose family sugar isomerase [Spirochaetia bacterium]|jgi:D-lyxose ketol-isomerase|nr:D-lyxose/D-mannose family sugar isomerase [Spirochaetia bacterium]